MEYADAVLIEQYFDLSCPYAYLASTRIEEVAARAGVALRWRPMLLGGVFRAVGTPDRMSEGMPPPKARHNAMDMARWAALWDVPLRVPAAHPIRTVRALRALLSLPEPRWPPVIHALYRAYWVDGIDLADEGGLDAALTAAGLDAAERARARAANDDPAIRDALRRRTDEAIGRGVFGAPTAFVAPREGDPAALMFWGQDRLAMVEAAARGWRPGEPTPAIPLLPAPRASAGTPPAEPTLDFYYDVSSPFAYLGSTQIERVAREVGARLRWRPMLLGGLFRAVGTPDVPLLAASPARQRYLARELTYWSSWWGVPFRYASRFPLRSIAPQRLALAAGEGAIAAVAHGFFRAAWVDDRDVADEAVQRDVLAAAGLDPAPLLARLGDPALKQALIDATADAAARGVFGAPTAIATTAGGEELFWGQDRLELAGRAAAGSPQPSFPTVG
jgi:2-hydroxychromene-2-carboxylate isomerase